MGFFAIGSGSGGSGDMEKAVYDPAAKEEQVLTTSDLSDISQVVVSTEATLQNYIDNDWTSGDLAIGDKVILTGGAENENWILAENPGSVVGDYIHLTATDSTEISNGSTVTGVTVTDALDKVNEQSTLKAHGILTLPSYTDNGDGTIDIDVD